VDLLNTIDLFFSEGDFSHKGYLRFVKVVEEGELCEDLGEKVLNRFVGR
jgi:hypothetical protein